MPPGRKPRRSPTSWPTHGDSWRHQQQLADAQAQLAEMRQQIAELDKTVQADKDTIDARLSDLAKLAEQNRALAALRDELEKQAQDAAAER